MVGNIFSFAIYMLIYIVAGFFFYLADKEISSNRDRKSIKFLAAGVIVLCLFAATRGENVGTDMQVYAIPLYNNTKALNSLATILSQDLRIEKIYYILAYISSHFFGRIEVFLFTLELLVFLPVTICIYKERKKIRMVVAMTFFMLLYYPMSLNAMRQSIAVAFLLLAISFFLNKKKLWSLVLSVVSIYFHSSAIIGIIILAIIIGISKIRKTIAKFITAIASVGFGFVFATRWYSIANSAIQIGLLPIKYSYKIYQFKENFSGGENIFATGKLGLVDLFFRLLLFILPLLMLWNKKNEDARLQFYIKTSLINIAIYVCIYFSLHTFYGYRIVMPLDYLNILYFPNLNIIFKLGNGNKLRGYSLMIIIALIYSFMYYCYAGAHQVMIL